MAVSYGFYNSVGGDRKYNATHMAQIFDGIINEGIFAAVGTKMMVTPAPTGKNVIVGEGRAWFNHTWTYNDAPLTIALDAPDVLFPRIDLIILEVNASDGVRENSIKVIKGAPGSSPDKPQWTNVGTLHQYPLAFVTVSNATANLLPADIENMVGSDYTPFVTGPLQSMSITSLVAQWESQYNLWLNGVDADFAAWFVGIQEEFNTQLLDPWLADFNAWFNAMKDQLTTDAAGNLQTQINDSLKVIARQGGAGVPDWNYIGITNYILANPKAKIQLGNGSVLAGDGRMTITFPIPFTHKPVIFLQPSLWMAGWPAMTGIVVETTTTGFIAEFTRHMTTAPYHGLFNLNSWCYWLAIGPVE